MSKTIAWTSFVYLLLLNKCIFYMKSWSCGLQRRLNVKNVIQMLEVENTLRIQSNCSTRQALWLTGTWRENNWRWEWVSCLIQSVMWEVNCTPVGSPGDGLPVLNGPQGGISCCACLLGVGSQKGERREGQTGCCDLCGCPRSPTLGLVMDRGGRGLTQAAEWVGGWVSVCLLSLVFSSQAEGRLNLDHCHYCSLFPPSLSLSLSLLLLQ